MVAAGLAPLVNLQLRAVKTTDLVRRLAKVEKLLARAEAEADLKGDGNTRGRDFGYCRPCQNSEGRENYREYGRGGADWPAPPLAAASNFSAAVHG
jgi:hypothetical protein